MRINSMVRGFVVALTCFGVVAPQLQAAGATAAVTAEGIPVRTQVEDVALQSNGELRGAVVDVNGKPVASAPVAVGQSGKVVAELQTDAEGRFAVTGLKTGTYQVASYAGVQSYRVWNAEAAPAKAKQGVIHVLPEGVARGQNNRSPLIRALTNPLVLAGGVAAAVAIGIAVTDDDAS